MPAGQRRVMARGDMPLRASDENRSSGSHPVARDHEDQKTASWGIICLGQRAQVGGEIGGGGQRVGVVLAQDAAAAVEGVLVQVAGGLELAQRAQVGGQVAGGGQRVGVVLAQDAAAAVEGVVGQVAGGLEVAQRTQVMSQVGSGDQGIGGGLAQDAAGGVEGGGGQVEGGL